MKMIRCLLCFLLCVAVKGEDAPVSSSPVAGTSNRWGQEWLLTQMEERPGENVCLSSLPLMFLCAETAAGAGGETRTQLLNFLEGGKSSGESSGESVGEPPVFADLSRLRGQLAENGGKSFLQRRRVYGNTGIEWRKSWQEALGKYFGAKFVPLDFSGGVEKCRQQINADIKKSTRGLIRDFVTPDMLTGETGVFLADVTGYAGTWQDQFDPADSKPGKFTKENGKTVPCRLMQDNFSSFFYEEKDYTVIWRYYKGSSFCFFALLPARGTSMKDFLKNAGKRDLVGESLACLKRERGEPTVLKLPAFTVSTPLASMKEFLKSRGVTEAFLPGKADFSGMMASKRPLHVQDGWQKVYFKVDEKGTQAYAASSMAAPFGSPPEKIVFDRPFLYLLADPKTGAALFMGAVFDPSR